MDSFDEEIDTLKFRLVLRPETDANNEASSASPPPLTQNASGFALGGAGGDVEEKGGERTNSALRLHRLMIQTVGGRSCSQVRRFTLFLNGFATRFRIWMISGGGVGGGRSCSFVPALLLCVRRIVFSWLWDICTLWHYLLVSPVI